MNHFLIRLWRATKSGFYMTAGSDQLVFGLSKLFTKPDWHQERSGHCLVVCCSSDPLQLFESWQNHYTWEVCSANWWDALKTATPAASGQQNGSSSSPWQHPTTCCTSNTSKIEWTGLQSFTSSTVFTWPLANWLPFLQASQQLFSGKALPQPAGGRKYFLRVGQIQNHGFLLYRNK